MSQDAQAPDEQPLTNSRGERVALGVVPPTSSQKAPL
jgi:hypothetical protein